MQSVKRALPALRSLSRTEVRSIDQRANSEFGMSGVVLMENAGRGVAELLQQLGINGSIAVCAGKGNNGGDGFVAARHLENRGYPVQVFLFTDPNSLTGDAATNFRILQAAKTPTVDAFTSPKCDRLIEQLRGCDWIVDGLLGTGTQGSIREPFLTAIDVINKASVKVLAVDLPSGMDCDAGQQLGACVKADHTATFVARKIGFDAPEAKRWTGEIHVIDIGVPRALLANWEAHSTDGSA